MPEIVNKEDRQSRQDPQEGAGAQREPAENMEAATACPEWLRVVVGWGPSALSERAYGLSRQGWQESGHTVHNKALNPVAKTFLLACACTDVAIFRTGEQ